MSTFYKIQRLLDRLDERDQQIATLVQERDRWHALANKWVATFNRSEQFQNGPTKRAEDAEAELIAIREGLERLVMAWTDPADGRSSNRCASDVEVLLATNLRVTLPKGR